MAAAQGRNNMQVSQRRTHTTSASQPALAYPSLFSLSEVLPGTESIQSSDARLLLVLLSFLSPATSIHPDNLICGATPRKRWCRGGNVESCDGVEVGLAPELCDLLSDRARLAEAFNQVELSAAYRNSDQTYTLQDGVANIIRDTIPNEHGSAWKLQALLVAYRAISWKHLEPVNPNIRLFLPHLRHAVVEYQTLERQLPVGLKKDLVLTLLESARFPGVPWKRFAVEKANDFSQDLNDRDIEFRIAQSRALIARITGNSNGSFSDHVSDARLAGTMDQYTNVILGQGVLQRALNCIQVEDLHLAKDVLENWNPMSDVVSPMEQTVVLRKAILLGRLSRFGGAFDASLLHLKSARAIADCPGVLVFDEDLRDLTCELADTLRELGDLAAADGFLRTEITRRDSNGVPESKASLELCLAEVLFAQDRLEEAHVICRGLEDHAALLRFEKLRLQLILGKLHHAINDSEALTHWSRALKEVGNFKLTNGRTTRIIVLSICDSLSRLGQEDLVRQSLQQVASLDDMAKSGAVEYWIAGMQHWALHLDSRHSSTHIGALA